MPFDISAEAMRQTIQNAAAAAIAPGDTFEPQKFAVMVERYENVYVIGFRAGCASSTKARGRSAQGEHERPHGGGATAAVTSRMDGINYYGIEHLNIDTGSNNDIFNIQGTTAGSRASTSAPMEYWAEEMMVFRSPTCGSTTATSRSLSPLMPTSILTPRTALTSSRATLTT